MHTCARCGKKRNLVERLFALDKEYCDCCLFGINKEIREKCVLPVRQHKPPHRGKK